VLAVAGDVCDIVTARAASKLPPSIARASAVVVERRAQALQEAGDLVPADPALRAGISS